MAHASPLSRRSLLAISAAAVAGSAGSLASVAKAASPAMAAPEPDALLIDTWPKYQEAKAREAAMDDEMRPLYHAARDAMPPPINRETFLKLTEAEREAYEEMRMQCYEDAWEKTGLSAAEREQQHLCDTVVYPLEKIIMETPPTTLKGIAIKVAFLLKYARAGILSTDDPEELDYDDLALRRFIDQLADLTAPGA